jgi:hypothetical protein
VIALGAASGGCGGFVESGEGVTRLTVGAQGGTLEAPGFALVIPPHSLTATFTLSVRRAPSDAPAGPAFTVEPVHVAFDPATPAEVRLESDAAAYPHVPEMFAAIATTDGWHSLTRPAGNSGSAGVVYGMTTTVGTFGPLNCPGGSCTTPDGGAADGGHD